MSNIIIPIEKSTNATSGFSTNNLFQQDALIKIKTLIGKNLKVSENYKYPINKNEFDRYHNAITILGERGTGKTSFLLNLEHFCDENNEFVFLDPLDPTLFEDKQNILVSVISLIADKVKYLEKENDDWIECLTKLADGLNLLDGIGSNPMQKDIWDDSRIILDKGLSSAHSGINFEKYFHEFISKSLQLLDDKKMFILRFDDIDTSVLKGWPVLEVIRKYLTSPKIQIIISGDISLFSKLVRLKQWENLEKLTEFEKNRNLCPTIDQLEEQYLTKILKPENRIYLLNLKSILKRNPDSIEIEYQKEYTLIDEIYDNIAERIFILKRERDKRFFINILLQLPVRTNIQILMAYYNNLHKNNNVEGFLDDFALIFMTNFSKFNFKYEDTFTLTSYTEDIVSYLIDKLIFIKEYKKLDTMQDLKSLQPIFKEKDLNLFLLYLNANIVNSLSNSISIIFDWYLKKFYFFKILDNNTNYNENEIINYFDINSPLIYIPSKINGLLFEDKQIYDNFAKIYRQVRQAKKNDFKFGFDNYETKIKNDLKDHLPEIFKTIKILEDILFTKIRTKNDSETHLTVSILNIFSFLGTILSFSEFSLESKIQEYLEEKIISKFEDNKYGDMILNKHEIDLENLSFYKDLEIWVALKENIQPISVQLIEDIWNEFYIQEKTMTTVNTVAEYLELQIFIFLNSIVRVFIKYESINESTQVIRSLYDKKNQSSAKTRFETNLKKYKKHSLSPDNNFLEYMITCPLWKYLINYNEKFSFQYNLTDSITYYDYLNLLPLHQGNSDEKIEITYEETINFVNSDNTNSNTIEDESSWPDKALTKAKIRRFIKAEDFNLEDENIENIIWEKIKYKDKIKGTIDYSGRRKRIQEVIKEFLLEQSDV